MRSLVVSVFKLKDFSKWAKRERIQDVDLVVLVYEMMRGLCGAHLGAYLYKKRIAAPGRGKSGALGRCLLIRCMIKLFLCMVFLKMKKLIFLR